jgi:hypothetical protein
MKKYIIKIFILIVLSCHITSCEDLLTEEVFSELTPENFLNTEEGIRSVLNSAYGNIQIRGFWYYFFSTMPSGEAWSKGGSIESINTPLSNFTWDSNIPWSNNAWNTPYAAIRDANILLDNIVNENFSEEFSNLMTAEAKFIRGFSYFLLYNWFGPTPIYDTSTPDDLKLPRASEEEMRAFIEQNLIDAAAGLPVDQKEYGRATKGSALAVLSKYYLNTKQWQKCVDMTQQIMDMDKYDLVSNYADVFSLENEGNEEMLWVYTATAQAGQNINALTFPTDYPRLPNQGVWAATTHFFDEFVNSFEAGDTRRNLIVTEYINTEGELKKLLGNDQSMSLKYEFDPNASGQAMGNDIPVVRYADILLARAESLNELDGPTQEAIDLINQVRERAGVSLLKRADFTKDSLRDHILQEREWEFYAEIKSREDQIRHGKFISEAQDRGKNAQPFHVLFPIPQTEIEANPNLEQNPEY